MNIFKRGFSLAEILIALAIVAVIATMAFTISKKGTESAYNQYIYTGYIGISDAITDATNEQLELEYNNVKDCDAIKHIMKILSVDDNYTYRNPNSDAITFLAPNKISYVIWTAGKKEGDETSESSPYFYIDMTVPSVRTGTASSSICFSYAPKENYSVLIPFQEDEQCISTIDNVQKRMDLLPFYIDNGRLGVRTTYNNSETSELEPRRFYSFQEAACKLYGDITTASKNLNCTGVDTSNVKPEKGVLRVANPRKVL